MEKEKYEPFLGKFSYSFSKTTEGSKNIPNLHAIGTQLTKVRLIQICRDNGIKGYSRLRKDEILERIQDSPQLHYLNLSWTSITSLPESIGRLSSLQTLNLSITSITVLPESIGHLSNLQTLDLSYNYSIESLPDSIIQLIRKMELKEIFFGHGYNRIKLDENGDVSDPVICNCFTSRTVLQRVGWSKYFREPFSTILKKVIQKDYFPDPIHLERICMDGDNSVFQYLEARLDSSHPVIQYIIDQRKLKIGSDFEIIR